MSDVIGVSVIAAGSSLLGSAIGAISAYKVSARGAKAAVETTESRNEVELARIEAENSRLLIQHNEDERRNRQTTYHRTLTALQRIYSLEMDSEDWEEVTAEWRYCRAGVHIFGSKKASDAVDKAHEVVLKLPGPSDDREGWDEELGTVLWGLIAAVRADIGVEND